MYAQSIAYGYEPSFAVESLAPVRIDGQGQRRCGLQYKPGYLA